MKKGYLPGGCICEKCAKREGCLWPADYCATFRVGECDYCGKRIPFDEGGVCDVGDWEWPGRTTATSEGLRRREL